MTRLTERHYVEKEGYYLKCSEAPNCPNDCEECNRLDDAIDRLGAYEDTGAAPADVKSMYAAVVRCRDCKYSTLPSMQTQIYGKPGTLTCCNRKSPCNHRNVASDDYCKQGERK